VTIFNQLIDGLGFILQIFHDLFEGMMGEHSWGMAIILLTVTVRVVLLPLAVKQINSMRGMQQLQPEIKKVQAKYKTDREMMKKNPEKYRERRQKQQEEMMALYKEHGVNPAAGCLPLLLQMPIFFALFRLLQDSGRGPDLTGVPFGIIDNLAALGRAGGVGGILLILAMGASTFYSQKQMMKSNPSSAANQQQKILLYVMPVMLVVFAVNMPIGVLLYWVTTNVWTIAQQYVMFRKVEPGPGAKAATA
jgi:YidC/Oxa1 family membrane protein insertase